ncbi:MAG: hypothetical protein AAB648_02095 [Patescibacteria group bacterium]
MNPEKEPQFNKSEEESSMEAQEMSPEDFEEMMDQVPALREMLDERKSRLEGLIKSPEKNSEEILVLENEIAELQEEIFAREEEL